MFKSRKGWLGGHGSRSVLTAQISGFRAAQKLSLLRYYFPRNDRTCISVLLRARPQGADSKALAAISNVTTGFVQQPRCPEFVTVFSLSLPERMGTQSIEVLAFCSC